MQFSILTITKNGEKYLDKTLESVKAQTFKNFEHILLDAHSDDNTIKIASNFPHVQIFQGEDSGISDAMNKIALRAKGKFLLFLHADDFLAHDQVLEALDLLLRQHPQTNWLYGRATFIDQEGALLRKSPFERHSRRRLLKYNFITHPATLVSRALFNQVGGFRRELKFAMDYDLWLRLSQVESPLTTELLVANVRLHQGSVSTREQRSVADESYQIRNKYIKNPFLRLKSYRTWKKRVKLAKD